MTRWYGIGVAILGAIVGMLPFARWYRADLPGRTIVRSGVEVSGALWSLPLLALVIVAIGVAIAVSRPDPVTTVARWLGGICAVAGAMCVG